MAGNPNFTMATDPILMGLHEARATGSEVESYLLLVRIEPMKRERGLDPFDVWTSAEFAEQIGMRARTFSQSLRNLTRKTFTTSDGDAMPVLTQTSRGHRGHCPHFDDNLGRAIAEGRYPDSGWSLDEEEAEANWDMFSAMFNG